ncbi:peptidoglycan-binding domain-containing protein, partial [Pseudoalteromonas sp. SIMBA_162]|uniref:peptidoglycan-binding domain-containing protein n=1 Tax=Pseudoalteromonas sp. SIMBA_162 TaxID=3080867 RepID=UPI003977F692
PETELKEGNASAAVNSAERMLDALGYSVGKVDDEFDRDTKNAVIQFQADHELKQTGSIAGETTYALMDAIREKIDQEDPH